MFWIIAGIVIVVLVALAWISSGLSKKRNTLDLTKGDTSAQGRGKGYAAQKDIGRNMGGPMNR